MIAVRIPILVHTAETLALQEQGSSYNLTDCDTQEVTIYSMSYVKQYREQGKNAPYSQIGCNGEVFISPLTTTEINNKIARAWTLQ